MISTSGLTRASVPRARRADADSARRVRGAPRACSVSRNARPCAARRALEIIGSRSEGQRLVLAVHVGAQVPFLGRRRQKRPMGCSKPENDLSHDCSLHKPACSLSGERPHHAYTVERARAQRIPCRPAQQTDMLCVFRREPREQEDPMSQRVSSIRKHSPSRRATPKWWRRRPRPGLSTSPASSGMIERVSSAAIFAFRPSRPSRISRLPSPPSAGNSSTS